METHPQRILNLGAGFMSAKILLTAVELGVFTHLAQGPESLNELSAHFRLSRRRSTQDFFDALVSLNLLERKNGIYANSAESDRFLDKNKATYVGGLLEMFNLRLYEFWGNFTVGLKTGLPQNEAKTGGGFFEALYSDSGRLNGFMTAMSGISLFPAKALAKKFPWNDYSSFADIGCARGVAPVEIVKVHPHLRGIGFDLPPVEPIFQKYIREQGVADTLTFQKGNFLEDDLPQSDVIVFGRILHDWSLDERKRLLRKALQAIRPGGAVIVYDCIIDDERRQNTFGLLSSLTMLIETPDGFDYTGKECMEWMTEAGFEGIRVEPVSGAESMVLGFKKGK